MKAKRRIAVVTGTRAEYGLLETVMRAIDGHPALALQCVASGTHLTTSTWKDIALPIAAKVPMQKAGRVGRLEDAVALGRGVSGFTEAFASLRPDAVLVLGDRIEAFAAASAAAVAGIRLGHIHGGDRAEGVADEAMRHAITKLAHVHFAATAQSRRRIIRMGEPPAQVFNVGSPAVDGIRDIPAERSGPAVIVMHHPVGDADDVEARRMAAVLKATAGLDRLVLAPNHDPGRAGVLRAIREARVSMVEHLPRAVFVAKLKAADLIVGNSSAGLIEAAVCRTPCVNVGRRQAGREKPGNVVDSDERVRDIQTAIKQARSLQRSKLRHPYGRGTTGEAIAGHVASAAWDATPITKRNTY